MSAGSDAANTDDANATGDTVHVRQYRDGRMQIREFDGVDDVERVHPPDDPTTTILRIEYVGGVTVRIPNAELLDGGESM